MAITKQRKEELVAEYSEWIKRSQATIVLEYVGMSMKDIDAMRAKTREINAEFHILKNTLAKIAFEKAGMQAKDELFTGSTAVAFAFGDAPALAKSILDFAKGQEKVKVKGGYLDGKPMTPAGVKALADLPPLPVMRAQLLGMLSAPASKLVRTLAEPGRSVAAVIKAYADRDAAAPAE